MLVLFVALADFGRIFANALLIESSARDGAELAANEYLATPPGPLNATSTGDSAYYDNLHLLAARAVCTETRELPNSQYDTATTNCPGMPLIKVCIHDGVDPNCGNEAFSSTVPSECNEMTGAMTNSQASVSERWVEVRVCYRFDSLVDVPLISMGHFWLQRTRTFVIPCYFVMQAEPCG